VRVLFDAIEQSVKDTAQATMINDIYQGRVKDFVCCLSCNTESVREDTFLDISLTIKSIFDQVLNDSIEKALQSYLKVDRLVGSN
jgi:ubiquitin carboxyl-terminal hydrolase 47